MALIDRQLTLMDAVEKEAVPALNSLFLYAYKAALEKFRASRNAPELPLDFQPNLNRLLEATWAAAISASAAAFREEFADGFPAEQKMAVTDILALFISSMRPQVAHQIVITTQAQIRDMILGGMAGGQAADEVYFSLLSRSEELSLLRAILITRTEVHSATQFAAWQLARQSLIRLDKVWNSISDTRTRDFGEIGKISAFNHRAMDGKRISLNEFFSVPRLGGGFEYLMFPGDPNGSAGNVINCRCIQSYVRA